jgi:hypothetical protein
MMRDCQRSKYASKAVARRACRFDAQWKTYEEDRKDRRFGMICKAYPLDGLIVSNLRAYAIQLADQVITELLPFPKLPAAGLTFI